MQAHSDYQFRYSQQDIDELNQIQARMLNLINTKENWENVSTTLNSEPSLFQRIKEKQSTQKPAHASSKELLGISPSSRVSYCPLLLRELSKNNNPKTQRKQLIPVQQALLEKYSAQWSEKAGADYPFVRLNNEQKVEFAHLVEGLNKEEMSRYIVIDPKDHRMYSNKDSFQNKEKGWSPQSSTESKNIKPKNNEERDFTI